MEDRLIANIIYKELFSYSTVFLQNIGFLALVDHPASLSQDGSTLRPPYRTVAAYHLDDRLEGSVDVVMAICQAASVDYSTAYSMYDGYLKKNLSGNVLTLPYVMQLRIDDMAILHIDERMRTALENQQLSPLVLRELGPEDGLQQQPPTPQPMAPQGNNRRGRLPYGLTSAPGGWQLAIAIVLVSVAALYLVYRYFLQELI